MTTNEMPEEIWISSSGIWYSTVKKHARSKPKTHYIRADKLEALESLNDFRLQEIAVIQGELEEQARLIGMGGERELALLAKLEAADRLYKELLILAEYHGPGTCPNYMEMNEALAEYQRVVGEGK